MLRVFFLLLATMLFACRTESFDGKFEKVNQLVRANPVEDFKKSVDLKDFRFYGVYGYSLTTPGVPVSCLAENQVNAIVGTSDAIEGYQEEVFNAVAYVYAKHFNVQMRVYLESRGMLDCVD